MRTVCSTSDYCMDVLSETPQHIRVDTQIAPTVAAILDRYQAECLQDLAPRTQRDYKRHLKTLKSEFGDWVAAEMKPRDFADFLNVKKGKITRVRQLAVLSAAFTIAVRRWYWIDVNMLRDVERPKSKPRDRLILDEEFEGCRSIASTRIQLAMQLALLTAQRQGDVIGFKWSDIRESLVDDWTNPGQKRVVNELHVYQSKTGKRIAIEITPDLEALLDKCWKLARGGNSGSEYVLPTRSGSPYTSEGFRACWQRVMNRYCRLGGERFHFHDIRALAATKCPTVEEAQQLLGHTSVAMTKRVYRRGIERVRPLNFSAINGPFGTRPGIRYRERRSEHVY